PTAIYTLSLHDALPILGCEIGQTEEWNHATGLPWYLLSYDYHAKLQRMVKELNSLYHREPALSEVEDEYAGFEWIDFRDADASRSEEHTSELQSRGHLV